MVQSDFYGLLKEEQGRGKTVFLSSHILSEVEKVCDRVAIIREGRIDRVFLVLLLGIVALTALALSGGLMAVGVEHAVRLILHIFVLNYLAAAAYEGVALLTLDHLRRAPPGDPLFERKDLAG